MMTDTHYPRCVFKDNSRGHNQVHNHGYVCKYVYTEMNKSTRTYARWKITI